uniref:Uncharacterized protein n=1 Tax=Anopheles maculatus TaxID=74869 RepID=A0A182T743_9DIPT
MMGTTLSKPSVHGVENKDDILSCAQLEARQQLSSDEAEQCITISNNSVVCSGDQLSIEQRPAAISLPSVASAGLERVKAEKTIPIPVRSSIAEASSYVELIADNSAEQAKRNESAASGGKVLLCVKNDTPAVVSSEPVQHTRILRELNSIPAVPKPSSASGSRPVSVTASIFNKPAVNGTPSQQSSASGSPQSVTAKLFVTLPPAVGGAGTTSCNPGSSGGVSGSKPQHATEKIFAPRTEDMNKGFLMFSEEEPGLTSPRLASVVK